MMLRVLKTMAKRYENYMTIMGRRRACEVLLSNSDHVLEDHGFSRELLEQGVSAWPWKFEPEQSNLKPVLYNQLINLGKVSADQSSSNDMMEEEQTDIAVRASHTHPSSGGINVSQGDSQKVA